MYTITAEEKARLGKDFMYHTPKPNQVSRYKEIRDEARDFAEVILVSCPSSRERSLAMTALEESVMWANASIARNEA
jgi:hypothetical protein